MREDVCGRWLQLTSRVHLSLGAAYGRSDGVAESLVGSGDSAQKLHGQERQGGPGGMVDGWTS